jgi:hypothetical protein
MSFLVHGRTDCRPPFRARECAQSTSFEALLVAAKRSCRIAKAASDIVLICVSRLKKQNHGIGFGSAIFDRVVGKDDTMDRNHALVFLGLNTNTIVDEDGTGS